MGLFDKFNIEKEIKNKISHNVAYKYDSYDNVESIHIEEVNFDCFTVETTVNVLGNISHCSFDYDDNYEIIAYDCECPYCDEQSPCAHIGAVLLKLNELDIQAYPFDYSNNQGLLQQQRVEEECKRREELIQKQKEQRRRKELERLSYNSKLAIGKYKKSYQNQLSSLVTQEQYEITPYFHKKFNTYYLDYKIGNEKKYIIKNIGNFLNNIEECNEVSYGKFLSFVHNEKAFTDSALKQIEFLKKANELYNQQMKNDYYYRYYNGQYYLARQVYITNINIDIFFETYKDYNLDIVSLKTIDQKIAIQFINKEDYYVFHLIEENLVYGEKNLYCLIESKKTLDIYQYNLDDEGKCVDFIKMFEDHKLIVLKDDFYEFYKYVLFPIKDYFDIKNMIEIKENEYEFIKIYGDVSDDSRVYFQIYYVDESHNRIPAFQDNFVTNYNQDIVEKYFLSVGDLDKETNHIYLDTNSEKTYEFINEGLDFLRQYADIYVSEGLKRIGKQVHYAVTVGVKIENDLLVLDIESMNLPKMEISKVLDQYKCKKKFYRLKNGDLLYLNSPELEELSQLVDQYHIDPKEIDNGKILLNKNRVFSIDEDVDKFKHIELERKESFQRIVNKFDENVQQQIMLSPYYENILRDYQKEGYQWLRTLNHYGFNGILADDMGLGKTLQVIALIDELKLRQSSIVICPSSLIYNWEEEVHKFAPHMQVACIVGNQKARQEIILDIKKYQMVITSYDYMRRDYELYQNIEFGYIILDESQYIKNQKTKNAQSVKQLNSKYKLALSGTPIENSLAELWSVFDFLMPKYLFNYHYFKKTYESEIVKNKNENTIKQLKKLVSPFILRRNKKDVLLELPDKIEKTQIIPFTTQESELYFANLAQVNSDLQELFKEENVNKVAILAMLTKLRQICCEPRMLYENIDVSSSKMKACVDLIQNYKENNQKVLLFSTFTKVFDLLEEELRLNGTKYFVLTGSTSKEERRNLVKRFQDGEADVFLISLKAGGTGLNLTVAEAVIHYDPWWNISAQNQATDRAYRIGQHNNVQVHKLIMKDSIEEKIVKLQEKKKELADMFVENNEGSISSLSKDEIMELFS